VNDAKPPEIGRATTLASLRAATAHASASSAHSARSIARASSTLQKDIGSG
jgi:hypothetical protein